MQRNLENLSAIKSKVKIYLKDPEILDIILFGSYIKGKNEPNDIDLAIISDKKEIKKIGGFHISLIKPKEIFFNPPSIINTLFREGYSLKNNKFLSEVMRFKSKILFSYSLTNLNPSTKVKIVKLLRGNNSKGMVKEYGGEWIARQVFIVPLNAEYIIEKLYY